MDCCVLVSFQRVSRGGGGASVCLDHSPCRVETGQHMAQRLSKGSRRGRDAQRAIELCWWPDAKKSGHWPPPTNRDVCCVDMHNSLGAGAIYWNSEKSGSSACPMLVLGGGGHRNAHGWMVMPLFELPPNIYRQASPLQVQQTKT